MQIQFRYDCTRLPDKSTEAHPELMPTPTRSDIEEVQGEVVAVIAELGQVKVLTADGRRYSLTRRTPGIDLSEVRVGQRVQCTETVRLPRVLSAQVLK
jgi:hypothetical protein